ncbi:MAG: DUF6790 family protein [Rhizomicrobium sp.]
MYIGIVVLLLVIAPIGSISYEMVYIHSTAPLLFLIGKWFTFWAVGVRLFIAGIRQTIQPRFTAHEIFKLEGDEAFPIVREVGFGNLAMGTLGLATLMKPEWLVAGALVGGLYYGLAGLVHVFGRERNLNENVAMISDVAVAVVLLGYCGGSLLGRGL